MDIKLLEYCGLTLLDFSQKFNEQFYLINTEAVLELNFIYKNKNHRQQKINISLKRLTAEQRKNISHDLLMNL